MLLYILVTENMKCSFKRTEGLSKMDEYEILLVKVLDMLYLLFRHHL